MSKRLLYLFGQPGSGKITVARILQQRLGWRLFWLHDLDQVCAIVGRYPLPRLMDKISLAVLEELMSAGEDIIYVRPSRDAETVERVLGLAEDNAYATHLVQLWASHKTLVRRVSSRSVSAFRISSEAELNRYLGARPATNCYATRWLLSTENLTAEQVADKIQQLLENDNGERNATSQPAIQAGGVPGQCAGLQPGMAHGA